jgi:hypothetical protein
MRLGRADRAVAIYQQMLLKGGVTVDPGAPVGYVVNFATALLLSGNTDGGIDVLDNMGRTDYPGAQRLRDAVSRWRRSLGFGRRILFALYAGAPKPPVVLDFPPGEV